MKEYLMKAKIFAMFMVLGFVFSAHAEEIGADHPCHKIKMACESAGYVKGGHKTGKGLWIDCFGKLKKGESVPGVSVAPGEVDACKAKMAERREHRNKK
jgi:hypothetical protein